VVDARAAVEALAGRPAEDALVLARLHVTGARVPGRTLTASLHAAWNDGKPVTVGATPHCRITVGGRAVRTRTSLARGTLSCAFVLPRGSGGEQVRGTLSVTAPRTPAATAAFELRVTRPRPG
jgi:hypothetical protein